MSLYDSIQCDYPLPDPEFQHEDFQTKDLDCLLGRYLITAQGRLWRLRRIDPFATDTLSLGNTEKMEDVNFHGDFSFYANTAKGWLKYRVRFTHGTVEWICRNPGDTPNIP